MNSQFSGSKIQTFLQQARKSPDPVIRGLETIWRDSKTVLILLFYCRWSVLVIAVGGGLLLLSGQGQEIAVRTVDSIAHVISVLFGAIFWATHIWLASRLMLVRIYGREEHNPSLQNAIDNFPRFLSLTAYIFAAAAFFMAWWHLGFPFSGTGWILPLLTIAFLVLCWPYFVLLAKRKELMRTYLQVEQGEDLDMLVAFITPVTVAYSLLFFLWACFAPVGFGFNLGSLGIVFFALSSLVATGSWLTLRAMDIVDAIALTHQANGMEAAKSSWGLFKLSLPLVVLAAVVYQFHIKGLVTLVLVSIYIWFARKTLRPLPELGKDFKAVPVLFILVLFALLFSAFNLNDNHRLSTGEAPNPPNFKAYADAWLKQAPVAPDDQRKPLVIVATAGGGIRAAYWTGAVLAEITDADQSFRRALFGISGVSGGSVGAAVYSATLDEIGTECAKATPDIQCLKGKVLKALSADFLAPVVARMLYPDLVQRFLPFPLLPDRASSLESAWQTAWADAMGKPSKAGLEKPLSGASSGNDVNAWQPALLLNSTHEETGKRVIASSVKLEASTFRDAVDLLSLLKKDVSLGTAALNSARFTYVSPPGTLPCSKEKAGFMTSFWCDNGHVVDGGYFENFGAITALQLLQTVNETFDEKQIRPIVILISNDSNLTKPSESIENDTPPESLPGIGFANETFGPIRALLDTRDARGILAAKDLRAVAKPENFFHFRMDLAKGQAEPALGWVLSKQSEAMMGKLMQSSECNRKEFERLILSLKGKTQKGDEPCPKT